jgi:hypothetical protein
MGQRAALLWYHDHVMGVTRFGVYAGLAGLWIIRDQRERELGLPEGPPFEVPLLIQDRNFGLDDSGRLTGQLIHKTDPGVMEAFPPRHGRQRQGLAAATRSAPRDHARRRDTAAPRSAHADHAVPRRALSGRHPRRQFLDSPACVPATCPPKKHRALPARNDPPGV